MEYWYLHVIAMLQIFSKTSKDEFPSGVFKFMIFIHKVKLRKNNFNFGLCSIAVFELTVCNYEHIQP